MKLVSNDRPGRRGGDAARSTTTTGQSFSTGRHPSGYQLTSLALELHRGQRRRRRRTPCPGRKCRRNNGNSATLTQQGSLTASPALIQFAAAGDGLDLKPDTTLPTWSSTSPAGRTPTPTSAGRLRRRRTRAGRRTSGSRTAGSPRGPAGNTIVGGCRCDGQHAEARRARPPEAPMVGNTGQLTQVTLRQLADQHPHRRRVHHRQPIRRRLHADRRGPPEVLTVTTPAGIRRSRPTP